MICDFDDFSQGQNRLDLLLKLRETNPLFRCTLFAIPTAGTDDFWHTVPEWCELAVHGWAHPDPWEASRWNYAEAEYVLKHRPSRFVEGFKAPGWQVSGETYEALRNHGWWIADHWDNDGRRPAGLRVHVISRSAGSGDDPNHWHGHIPDVCGNGIAETFDRLQERVYRAESFEWISEVVK